VTTVVPNPPPVANAENAAPTTRNEAGQVWVPAHYAWTGQWTWVDGNWQNPPGANATWVPGRYEAQTKRWTEGHWEQSSAATDRVTPPR
jgi:hypothetical protein